MNCGLISTNTSGYKGVGWRKDMCLWYAKITFNYEQIHLGYFKSAEAAVAAYRKAAKRIHGQFARIK